MSNRGVSTIELLVAIAVVIMAVTASVYVAVSVPGIIADARRAANALEATLTQLNAGVASSTPLEDAHFARLTSQASWTTSRGEMHSVEVSGITISNHEQEACDPFTSGDWSAPARIRPHTLTRGDLTPSISSNFTISALAAAPSFLAVAVASTSASNAPTILFFSYQSNGVLRPINSFDTASTSRIGNSSVAVNGEYAFVGNAFSSVSSSTCSDGTSCAQINTYKVSSQSAAFTSSLSLSTSSEPFAQAIGGESAPASSITYADGLLYVGLQKTVHGDEFDIIDAHDPTQLRWISGYPVGRTVNNIYIRDELAYVSTDDPARELMVFDVHNPSRPTLLSTWDAPGLSTFGYGSASTAYGNYVRFGRTYISNSPEFELLNLSSDGVITDSEDIDFGTPRDPESIRALLTQDRLTFALLSHYLIVLDTHDPAHAKKIGLYYLVPYAQGVAMACRNNQLFVATNGENGVGHIDIVQGA